MSGTKWKTLAYQFSPWSAWASAIPISALGQAFILQLPSWPLPSRSPSPMACGYNPSLGTPLLCHHLTLPWF